MVLGKAHYAYGLELFGLGEVLPSRFRSNCFSVINRDGWGGPFQGLESLGRGLQFVVNEVGMDLTEQEVRFFHS